MCRSPVHYVYSSCHWISDTCRLWGHQSRAPPPLCWERLENPSVRITDTNAQNEWSVPDKFPWDTPYLRTLGKKRIRNLRYWRTSAYVPNPCHLALKRKLLCQESSSLLNHYIMTRYCHHMGGDYAKAAAHWVGPCGFQLSWCGDAVDMVPVLYRQTCHKVQQQVQQQMKIRYKIQIYVFLYGPNFIPKHFWKVFWLTS